jgi:hypothetical protein
MIAQLAGIRIGVTGAARKYKLYGSQELFISLNQQVTILFRRKTAEKKNVVACCEPHPASLDVERCRRIMVPFGTYVTRLKYRDW